MGTFKRYVTASHGRRREVPGGGGALGADGHAPHLEISPHPPEPTTASSRGR